MAIYNMAGHNLHDSGAVDNGYRENLLTIDFRNTVNQFLDKKDYRIINDDDNDSLATMLRKLQSGNGSVCIEWHFDEADNRDANGCSAFVKDGATSLSVKMAQEITEGFNTIMGTTNRGVKTPSQSHRGSLAMPKMPGTTCLVEIAFLSSEFNMKSYFSHKEELAKFAAKVMEKYDDIIK